MTLTAADRQALAWLRGSPALSELLSSRAAASSLAAGIPTACLLAALTETTLSRLARLALAGSTAEQAEADLLSALPGLARAEAKALRERQQQAGCLVTGRLETEPLVRLIEAEAERQARQRGTDSAETLSQALGLLLTLAGQSVLTYEAAGLSEPEAVSRAAADLVADRPNKRDSSKVTTMASRAAGLAIRGSQRAGRLALQQASLSSLAALTGTEAEAQAAGLTLARQSSKDKAAAKAARQRARAEALTSAASLSDKQAAAVLAAYKDFAWQPATMKTGSPGQLPSSRMTEPAAEAQLLAALAQQAASKAAVSVGSGQTVWQPAAGKRGDASQAAWLSLARAAEAAGLSPVSLLLSDSQALLPGTDSQPLPEPDTGQQGSYRAEALRLRKGQGQPAGQLLAERALLTGRLADRAGLTDPGSRQALRQALACHSCRAAVQDSRASVNAQARLAAWQGRAELLAALSASGIPAWQAQAKTLARLADPEPVLPRGDWLLSSPRPCPRCLAGYLVARAAREAEAALAEPALSGSDWLAWQTEPVPTGQPVPGLLRGSGTTAEADKARDSLARLSPVWLALTAASEQTSADPAAHWLSPALLASQAARQQAAREAAIGRAAEADRQAAWLLAQPLASVRAARAAGQAEALAEAEHGGSKAARRWLSMEQGSPAGRLSLSVRQLTAERKDKAADSLLADWLAWPARGPWLSQTLPVRAEPEPALSAETLSQADSADLSDRQTLAALLRAEAERLRQAVGTVDSYCLAWLLPLWQAGSLSPALALPVGRLLSNRLAWLLSMMTGCPADTEPDTEPVPAAEQPQADPDRLARAAAARQAADKAASQAAASQASYLLRVSLSDRARGYALLAEAEAGSEQIDSTADSLA